jgi:hypothetical protein
VEWLKVKALSSSPSTAKERKGIFLPFFQTSQKRFDALPKN